MAQVISRAQPVCRRSLFLGAVAPPTTGLATAYGRVRPVFSATQHVWRWHGPPTPVYTPNTTFMAYVDPDQATLVSITTDSYDADPMRAKLIR